MSVIDDYEKGLNRARAAKFRASHPALCRLWCREKMRQRRAADPAYCQMERAAAVARYHAKHPEARYYRVVRS